MGLSLISPFISSKRSSAQSATVCSPVVHARSARALRRGHAVVLGGSMAGLLAARVVADHFERVTVVERDRFASVPAPRKGLPQARHAHVLLEEGRRILETLFPGIQTELADAGAAVLDAAGDIAWFTPAGWAVRGPSGVGMLSASRDLLEYVVRRRVAARQGVRFLEGADVVGLLPDAAGTGIAGVRVRRRDPAGSEGSEECLGANLVADASGRGSRAPRWLQALGYPAPRETVVNSFLAYASRVFRRPGSLPARAGAVYLQGTPTNGGRGGLMLPIEGERLIVTLTGRGGTCPPTDEAGFLSFARDLGCPALYDIIREAEPLGPIAGHRATENRVRHYESLERRPEGFVVLGDAACAFNPVYGQGMTTAARSAVTLGELLRCQRSGSRAGLARRFQKEQARYNSTPWLLATAEDLSYPATAGERPGGWTARKQRHLGRVVRLSTHDLEARRRVLQVLHLTRPFLSLYRPGVLLALLRDRLRSVRRCSRSNDAKEGAGVSVR